MRYYDPAEGAGVLAVDEAEVEGPEGLGHTGTYLFLRRGRCGPRPGRPRLPAEIPPLAVQVQVQVDGRQDSEARAEDPRLWKW